MRNADVLVHVGPVDADASTDALPVRPLLIGRVGQPRELGERGTDLAAVLHGQIDAPLVEAVTLHSICRTGIARYLTRQSLGGSIIYAR